MKPHRLSLLLGALVLLTAVQPTVTQAQEERAVRFCFVDLFAYIWDLRLDLETGQVAGIVDLGPPASPPDWIGTGQRIDASLTLRADNPDGDGCTTETDYFIYNGSVSEIGNGYYHFSGTWQSFCHQFGLIDSGDIEGTAERGRCDVERVRALAPDEPATRGPATHPRAQNALARAAGGFGLTSYPNPLTDRATIAYTLLEPVEVRLAVFDVLGREVALLVDGAQDAGPHTAAFDASSLPPGMYVYRLQAGTHATVGELIVVK